ncbi:MAG: site-2 protease family protein [Candidatus Promineifilaceae bacterium]|jgi:Zn-dependent protease
MLTSGLDPVTIIVRSIVLLIALPLHELAHALMADYLGDPTPRSQGRITLNPLKHLDVFGTIAFLMVGVGWAKPVMVNPFNMRGNPHTDMAIVAVVGPITNFLLALLGAIPFHIGLFTSLFTAHPETMGYVFYFLNEFVFLNLALAFFNLLPVPPLDGYKILLGLLPYDIGLKLRPLNQYGFIILIALLFLLPQIGVDVLGTIVWQPTMTLYQALIGL